jgi:L-malate glycosyltransferase
MARQSADAVIGLVPALVAMAHLRSGALAGAQRYTLNNMVARFVDGIEKCLEMKKKH